MKNWNVAWNERTPSGKILTISKSFESEAEAKSEAENATTLYLMRNVWITTPQGNKILY